MDEQVFLTLVRDNNDDQELEINNDVTLLDLIDFFLELQLQIDDSDGIQCVNKPENIFYQDQFHLNMKQIQQMTGEKRLKFKIIKRKLQFKPFQDPPQTIELVHNQSLLNQSEQQIKLDFKLFEQQIQTLELASNVSLQEILEFLTSRLQINLGNDEICYEDAAGLRLHPGSLVSQIQVYNNKRLLKILKDDQVLLTLVRENNEDQELQINNDVTLHELIEFFQGQFQLQFQDYYGLQCVTKPEHVFYKDEQFHLNLKQIQQITGEKKLKIKIVKMQAY